MHLNNADKTPLLISLICITFGTCEVRRLKRNQVLIISNVYFIVLVRLRNRIPSKNRFKIRSEIYPKILLGFVYTS